MSPWGEASASDSRHDHEIHPTHSDEEQRRSPGGPTRRLMYSAEDISPTTLPSQAPPRWRTHRVSDR
ncbi:MAG TPA: hypothetical protein DEF51_50295 [Myxococcales bacterium]|nr:hypothetical protein [Myxococcales bacterium]